jgi:hypothetical protein
MNNPSSHSHPGREHNSLLAGTHRRRTAAGPAFAARRAESSQSRSRVRFRKRQCAKPDAVKRIENCRGNFRLQKLVALSTIAETTVCMRTSGWHGEHHLPACRNPISTHMRRVIPAINTACPDRRPGAPECPTHENPFPRLMGRPRVRTVPATCPAQAIRGVVWQLLFGIIKNLPAV